MRQYVSLAGIGYDLRYHDRDVKVMLHFLPIPLLVDMEKILEFVNHAVFGITQILFIKCVFKRYLQHLEMVRVSIYCHVTFISLYHHESRGGRVLGGSARGYETVIFQ